MRRTCFSPRVVNLRSFLPWKALEAGSLIGFKMEINSLGICKDSENMELVHENGVWGMCFFLGIDGDLFQFWSDWWGQFWNSRIDNLSDDRGDMGNLCGSLLFMHKLLMLSTIQKLFLYFDWSWVRDLQELLGRALIFIRKHWARPWIFCQLGDLLQWQYSEERVWFGSLVSG